MSGEARQEQLDTLAEKRALKQTVRWTPEEDKIAVKLLKAGLTNHEINAYLVDIEWQRQQAAEWPVAWKEKAKHLKSKGLSDDQIFEHFERDAAILSHTSVSRVR